MSNTDYVVGFLFDKERERVVLIKKNRPDWQKGLLNGVGGHIEKDEAPYDAMIREFEEETGVVVLSWKRYQVTKYPGATLHIYRAFHTKALESVKSTTDEQVTVATIKELPDNIIANLAWLIPMALDAFQPECGIANDNDGCYAAFEAIKKHCSTAISYEIYNDIMRIIHKHTDFDVGDILEIYLTAAKKEG